MPRKILDYRPDKHPYTIEKCGHCPIFQRMEGRCGMSGVAVSEDTDPFTVNCWLPRMGGDIKEKTVKKVNKIIRLHISQDDYEEGIWMIQNAIILATTHGYWDNKRAKRVFGDDGWLPDWEELEDLESQPDPMEGDEHE